MKYKHIIFDIDGTLLDSSDALLRSLQDTVFEILHKKVDIGDLTFAMGIPAKVSFKKLGIDDVVMAGNLWEKNLLNYFDSISLFDGIEELLKDLTNKGISLGIITSKTRQEYQSDFMQFGVAKYFKNVICADEAPHPKPFAEPLLKYMEKGNATTAESMYIGDTVYDFECAQNACVDFGLAMWGGSSKKGIKANYFFTSPAEILKAID